MSNEEKEKKKDKSIYNYNMLFNKIGNDNREEDIEFDIDLISDIDLRNFDPKRYEYYTSLLKIYNDDPDTLFNLLNKYNKIKYTKEEEKKLIRQIYDYAVKYAKAKNAEEFKGGEGGKPEGGKPERLKNTVESLITKQNVVKTFEEISQNKSKETIDNNNTNIDNLIEYLIKRIDNVDNPNEVGVPVTKYVDNSAKDNQSQQSSVVTQPAITKTEKTKVTPPPVTPPPVTPPPVTPQPVTKTVTPPVKLPAISETNEDKLLEEAIKLSLEFIKGNSGEQTTHDTPKVPEEENMVDSSLVLMDNIIEDIRPKNMVDSSLLLTGNIIKDNDTKDIVDSSMTLMEEIVSDASDQAKKLGGGKRKKTGGGPADYEDDILKMQYLDTKRYNDIDKEKLDEYRGVQKTRKNNIAPIKTSNKIEQLSNDIDVYNIQIPKNIADDKYIIQQIRNFENDPKNPIEELALTFDDRIVFIIATFFIRYITIIMVQWCIDINIIKTFYEGFIYYAIIYILIFWFIVLFVNIDNTYDVKYMNFNGLINSIRTLFYYFYMGTNGISRLLIHTSLILILIVIPIILNIKSKTEFKEDDQNEAVVILTYEERKQLSKSLSLFTMFIWLFTSIIATKF